MIFLLCVREIISKLLFMQEPTIIFPLSLDSETVRDLLNPIFSNPDVKKVGVNLKFDIKVLEEKGYQVRGVLCFVSIYCTRISAILV